MIGLQHDPHFMKFDNVHTIYAILVTINSSEIPSRKVLWFSIEILNFLLYSFVCVTMAQNEYLLFMQVALNTQVSLQQQEMHLTAGGALPQVR